MLGGGVEVPAPVLEAHQRRRRVQSDDADVAVGTIDRQIEAVVVGVGVLTDDHRGTAPHRDTAGELTAAIDPVQVVVRQVGPLEGCLMLGGVLAEHDDIGCEIERGCRRRRRCGRCGTAGSPTPPADRRRRPPDPPARSGKASGAARTRMPNPMAAHTVANRSRRRHSATSAMGTTSRPRYGVRDWMTATLRVPAHPNAWVRATAPTSDDDRPADQFQCPCPRTHRGRVRPVAVSDGAHGAFIAHRT